MQWTTTKWTKTITMVGWKPPEKNWVKLNTNGLCFQGRRAGCGGIIRDMDEECKGGFYKSKGNCSAIKVELWEIYKGLLIT